MTPEEALGFVQDAGVVLASAKGPVANLAQAIAGEPIKGSWWSHPRGKAIFAGLQAVEHSPDILVCRVVAGKVTFVHRRLWPALARLSDRFPAKNLASIRQEHTASGQHVNHVEPYPAWVPAEARSEAEGLSEAEARTLLGDWTPT